MLPGYHRPGDSRGLFAGRTWHPLGRKCHGSHDESPAEDACYTLATTYEIRLWAVASGRNLFTRQGAGWIARDLAFSSDGRYAASSENSLSEQPILIWDLRTGRLRTKLNLKDKTQ